MVKILDASVANAAVLGPQRSQAPASVAQSGQHYVPLLPFVVVRNLPEKKSVLNVHFFLRNHLSDCSVVALGVERDATGVSSVGHDPANPHHKVPVDEAIMRSPKHIPGDWDALQILIDARHKIYSHVLLGR